MSTIDPPGPGSEGAGATDPDDIATADDIAVLNRMAVERSAAFTRIAGGVVLVIGVVGALSWLWLTVRLQLELDDNSGITGVPSIDGFDERTTWLDRVDSLTSYVHLLVFAGLALGLGLALRTMSDYVVARTGGSLTGFRVGDDLVLQADELALTPTDPRRTL